jgi:hypothetical protein
MLVVLRLGMMLYLAVMVVALGMSFRIVMLFSFLGRYR